MRPLFAVMAIAAALLAGACGERTEPTGTIPPSYPVTVAGAGENPLTLKQRPERLVALDAGSAELVAALGAANILVGAPVGASLPAGSDVHEVVKASGQIDVAAAVRLDPDLVIAIPDTDRVDVAQVVQRSGASLYIQPSRTIDDVRRATIELGFLLGYPVEARELNSSLAAQVAGVEARLEGTPSVKVFVDTGLFVTISDTSIFADLIREAHGENIAPDPALGPVQATDLAAADPDVYLTTSDSGVTLQSLQRNPDTRNLRAVQDGRVVILPVDLVTHAGPNVGKALEEVAAALHPDAFR